MKKSIILSLALLLMLTQSACAVSVGDKASDFSVTDINSNEINLSKLLSEKPVLLDFWASWCPPCRKEAPRVQQFFERHKDKVSVVGINVGESEAAVRSFNEKLGLTYPMAIDSGDIAREYGVVGIPTIVLIGKDKTILYYGHSVHEAEAKLR